MPENAISVHKSTKMTHKSQKQTWNQNQVSQFWSGGLVSSRGHTKLKSSMQYPQINFKRYTNHSNSTETYTEHNPKTITTAFSVPVAPHTRPLRKDGGGGEPHYSPNCGLLCNRETEGTVPNPANNKLDPYTG